MIKLNETPVTVDQIDSLGHLNVRYYIERMDDANRRLLSGLGITGNADTFLRRVDTYNKFRREQFEGAVLSTHGALIAEGLIGPAGSVPAYFEVRNEATGEIAASFLTATLRVDQTTQQPVGAMVSEGSPSSGELAPMAPPEASLPRSLSLSAPRVIPMQTLMDELPTEIVQGNMTGRRENVVKVEDCDDRGRLREDVDLMTIVFRALPQDADDQATMGPPIQRDESGRRFAWAMMETRSYVFEYPHVGDAVIALSVDLDCGDKWRQTRRFMFNKGSGSILGVYDSIGVCIDLDARRAIETPAALKELIKATARPDWR
jgi:acyl-CoA thioesterase FadM